MAFRLGTIPKAVDTIDLPLGVTVSVRPITTPIWHQAQAFASRAVLAFIEGEEIRDDFGIDRELMPDLTDPDAKEGFRQLLFAQALARAAILSWQGVLAEDGTPAPVTPRAINELMLVHAFAESFVIRYAARIIRALDEGKRIRALAEWHFGEGPGYCQACRDQQTDCAKGRRGLNHQRCPHVENAPVTEQGDAIWSLITTWQSQLRAGGMGAIGFDIPALISIGERMGLETDLLLLMLPFADAGLSQAMATQRQRHQQESRIRNHG